VIIFSIKKQVNVNLNPFAAKVKNIIKLQINVTTNVVIISIIKKQEDVNLNLFALII
jgi:hypothetical protein